MDETREQKFKRLAEYRTNVILDKIRILGNLSNKANYSYTDEEVNKIFRVIEKQIKQTRARFKTSRKKKFVL